MAINPNNSGNWNKALTGKLVHGLDSGDFFTLPKEPLRIKKEAIRKAVLELFDDPDFVDQIQWKLALHEKPAPDSPKDPI